MDLYIVKPGRMLRKGNTLCFRHEDDPEGQPRYLPVENTGAVHFLGKVETNTDCINLLAQHHIAAHFYGWNGNHLSTLLPHAEHVSGDVVIAQVAAYRCRERRRHIGAKIIEATLLNILSNLKPHAGPKSQEATGLIRNNLEIVRSEPSIEELMGLEGRSRKAYYTAWEELLGEHFNR